MNELTPREKTELKDVERDANMRQLSENVFQNPEEFNNLWKVAGLFAKSSIVPANYRGKPEDCMIAVDMANRMNVSPLMVMQNLYVVQGVPSWSGQACNTLIRSSGRFRDIKHVYTGTPGTDSWGCYLQAVRISDGEVVKGTEITIAMAKAEKWWSKKDRYGNETSKWQTFPQQMLAYRASAFFARVHCPDRLMGIQTDVEVIDMTPSEAPDQSIQDPFAKPAAKTEIDGQVTLNL